MSVIVVFLRPLGLRLVPLIAVSLLYLLIKSGNLLLWTIFPLLAVVFFIKKQITKAKAPKSDRSHVVL